MEVLIAWTKLCTAEQLFCIRSLSHLFVVFRIYQLLMLINAKRNEWGCKADVFVPFAFESN